MTTIAIIGNNGYAYVKLTTKTKIKLLQKYESVLYYQYVGHVAKLIHRILKDNLLYKTENDGCLKEFICRVSHIVEDNKNCADLESITWFRHGDIIYASNTYGVTDILKTRNSRDNIVAHIQWDYYQSPVTAASIESDFIKSKRSIAEQIAYVTTQIKTFRVPPNAYYIRLVHHDERHLAKICGGFYDYLTSHEQTTPSIYLAIFPKRRMLLLNDIDIVQCECYEDIIARLKLGPANHRSLGNEIHGIVDIYF